MNSNTTPEKAFRLQNRRLHLTYKTHIDGNSWLAWFEKNKKVEICFYSIVQESSDENHPYDHTHILIDAGYNKKFSTRCCRYFDWPTNSENIHPNIKKVTSSKHWENTVLYHYKENTPLTNIEKPIDCKEQLKNIWKQDTVSDALLATCTSLKNVGGVIAAFNCKPSDYGIEPEVKWNSWQKDLYEELNSTPDDRKIIWNYDPEGKNGKTFFAKHMGMYKGAFVSTKANTYHVATSIDEFIKKNGNTVLVVIFNFTRQQEVHNVYQALEELKDGLVTSEKYKGKTIFFNSPHVVVFANYLPEIKHLTIDRWDIRIIQDEKIVKRYLAGEAVFEDSCIKPHITKKLEILDNQTKNNDDEKYENFINNLPNNTEFINNIFKKKEVIEQRRQLPRAP